MNDFKFLIGLIVLITFSCSKEEIGYLKRELGLRGEQFLFTDDSDHIDQTPYTFMDFDGFKHVLDTPCYKYSMTQEDVDLTEEIIQSYMDEHDRTLNPEWMVSMDSLKNYKRQYVSGISAKGDTLIYVNCFCDTDFRGQILWRKEIIRAFGGGSCFFRLKIDLGKREYYDAETNAYC